MNRKDSITGSVSSLFLGCGPLTIHRPIIGNALRTISTSVAALSIDSVYGFVCGTLSQVKKKFRKRSSPSIAHKYTACSIAMVLFLSGIVASLFCETPTGVGPISFSHVSRPVPMRPFQNRIRFFQPFGTQFIFPTSTRNSNIEPHGTRKFGVGSYFFFPAITKTNPISDWFSTNYSGLSFFNNCELSNFRSGRYYYFRHNGLIVFASGGHSPTRGDRCAILPKLFPRRNCSGGPNWGGGVVSSAPSES